MRQIYFHIKVRWNVIIKRIRRRLRRVPNVRRYLRFRLNCKKHLAIHHSNEESTLSCPQCDRKFLYPSYLERHMAMHIQNKEHQCPICQRQFAVRNALLTHLQRHYPDSSRRQQNSNKCRFCTNSYRHESILERHIEQVHGDRLGFVIKSKINSSIGGQDEMVQIVNSISL